MKNTISIFLLSFFLFNCEDQNVQLKERHSQLEGKQQFKIIEANPSEISTVKSWMNSSSGSTMAGYQVENLKKLIDFKNNASIFTILNTENSEWATSFVLDSERNVKIAFRTRTQIDQNKKVTCQAYTLEDDLMISFIDYPDGKREVTQHKVNSKIGKKGWWSATNDCVNQFHTFSAYSIVNMVIVDVFNASTFGFYTPLSLVFCSAVGLGEI